MDLPEAQGSRHSGKGIQIRNPRNVFACGIWNLWNFDGGIYGLWDLESGIHGVESRIHDSHWFPYMGRQGDALLDFIAQSVERFM